MSNAILIKEVNNSPCIFNVDNATDIARLEALQAVKMAEEMAADIFGENAQYADIMNCSISANPDNPAFPFNVVFDSSKIPEKPKRELAAMAGLAMPSDKYIEFVLSLNDANAMWGPAPADGYFQINVRGGENVKTSIYLGFNSSQSLKNHMSSAKIGSGIASLSAFLPVRKGNMVPYWVQGSGVRGFFIYAEGTI